MATVDKAKEKKLQILRKGFTIFLKKGLSEARLDDILEEISMKKGNFYYYFSSKEEFLKESIIECYGKTTKEFLETTQKFEGTAREIIENYFITMPFMMEKALRRITGYKELKIRDVLLVGMEGVKKLEFMEEMYQEHSEEVQNWIASLLTEDQENGAFSKEIDAKSFSKFFYTCCEGAVYVYMINPKNDYKALMENIFRFVWREAYEN